MKRKRIVAGNWKMNCTLEEAYSLATEISGIVTDEKNNDAIVILSPPFVYLSAVAQIVKGSGIKVAAQNCSSEASGAFTGEVSAKMIHLVGAAYVLIGHSERRIYFNETSETLSKKTMQCLENGLIPIFCVGESLSQREAGEQENTVSQQLSESLFHLDADTFSKVIIAYEPVWAIGTGRTATPQQAQEMHSYIRTLISSKYGTGIADSISILYGGSCNEANAKELFLLPDVDGGLIGGASLKSRSFVNIVKSF